MFVINSIHLLLKFFLKKKFKKVCQFGKRQYLCIRNRERPVSQCATLDASLAQLARARDL